LNIPLPIEVAVAGRIARTSAWQFSKMESASAPAPPETTALVSDEQCPNANWPIETTVEGTETSRSDSHRRNAEAPILSKDAGNVASAKALHEAKEAEPMETSPSGSVAETRFRQS
jgi:hypothetical protein